jgi:hypothetical protein
MSISAYLVCHSRRLTINLGKPLRGPDDTVLAHDQGFLQGAARAQLDRALWRFLADTAGEPLVVVHDGDEAFETVAAYPEIGGDREDGGIPFHVYLDEPEAGADPPVADVVYFGVRSRDPHDHRPVGVVRRRLVEGHAVDEAFTRRGQWEPTLRLRDQELGIGDVKLVPIPASEAESFVARIVT